jgi:hypothetical protein
LVLKNGTIKTSVIWVFTADFKVLCAVIVATSDIFLPRLKNSSEGRVESTTEILGFEAAALLFAGLPFFNRRFFSF